MAEGDFDLTCTELCGWGHYKMRGRVLAQTRREYEAYLKTLESEQNFDGVTPASGSGALVASWGATEIESESTETE